MWFGETPSSSIVYNGHLAALLMPISAYAGQAMAQWPPAPQAIMFGFTRWKGLIGSTHAPDWTCFTPVGLHRIKGSPSPPGTIIRAHTPHGQALCPVFALTCNALMFAHVGSKELHTHSVSCTTQTCKHNSHSYRANVTTLRIQHHHAEAQMYSHSCAHELYADSRWFLLRSLGVSVVLHKAETVTFASFLSPCLLHDVSEFSFSSLPFTPYLILALD